MTLKSWRKLCAQGLDDPMHFLVFITMRALGNSTVPPWCLPVGREYFSLDGGELRTVDGWLNELPEADETGRRNSSCDIELRTIYMLSVALGQLWPIHPSFNCDFPPEGEAFELWTQNFQNLFIHLDADFLIAGLSQQDSAITKKDCKRAKKIQGRAKKETEKWQQKVSAKLMHLIRRDNDDKYCDYSILSFVNNLRFHKKQTDALIERVLSKTQDRILDYQSKIVRMALETCARQVLAKDPCVPAYVLPFPVLKVEFLRLAKQISKEEIYKSTIQGHTRTLSGEEMLEEDDYSENEEKKNQDDSEY